MDTLNDFIKETFGGKSICELAQIEQKLTDVKELLIWIDKCSVLEGKLLRKDEEIVLLRDALAVACLEIEYILKPSPKHITRQGCPICYFTEPVNDCDNDCPVCLANYFLSRAKAEREATENNKAVKIEQGGVK